MITREELLVLKTRLDNYRLNYTHCGNCDRSVLASEEAEHLIQECRDLVRALLADLTPHENGPAGAYARVRANLS